MWKPALVCAAVAFVWLFTSVAQAQLMPEYRISARRVQTYQPLSSRGLRHKEALRANLPNIEQLLSTRRVNLRQSLSARRVYHEPLSARCVPLKQKGGIQFPTPVDDQAPIPAVSVVVYDKSFLGKPTPAPLRETPRSAR